MAANQNNNKISSLSDLKRDEGWAAQPGISSTFKQHTTLAKWLSSTSLATGAFAAMVMAGVMATSPASAQQLWDPNPTAGVQGGTGTWDNTTPNFTQDNGATNVVHNNTNFVVFSGTGGVVTIVGTQSLTNSTAFSSSGYVLQGGVLDGGGAQRSINVTAGISATINLAIIGTGTLIKSNGGTLILGPASSVAGRMEVNTGTLTTTGTLSDALANNSIVNAEGTILGTIGNSGDFNVTGNLVGNAGFFNNPTATLNVNVGAFTGIVTLNNNSDEAIGITIATGATLSANDIDNSGVLSNAGTLTSTNVIDNSFFGTLASTGIVTGGVDNRNIVNAQGTVSGVITNLSTGRFNVTGNLVANDTFNNTSFSTLNINSGNFTGITTLTNAGTVTIAAGSRLEAAAINNNAGTINVGVGSTLSGTGNTFNNGAVVNVASNGVVTDAGDINNLAGGVFNFNGPNGTATFFSGTNTITNLGAINILGGDVTVTGNLDNLAAGTGTINVTGGNLTGITTLTNSSTATVGVNVAATRSLSANAVINAAGSTIVNSGSLTSAVALQNAGTLTNNAGANLNGGVNHTAGVLTNAGSINGIVTQTGGTMTNSGSLNGGPIVTGGIFTTTGIINGTLDNSAVANAQGAINGAITNQGSGVLNVTGNLVLQNATVSNNGAATLNVNAGSLTGISTLTNNSTAVTGVNIASGSSVSANAVINAAGATLINSGSLTSVVSAHQNAGTLTNNAGANLNGTVNNTAGILTNAGNINGLVIQTGGIVTNSGSLNGGPTITGGTFTTTGIINGTLDNSAVANAEGSINGVVINRGTGVLNITGDLGGNLSSVTNTGTIAIANGRTLSAGVIDNNTGGTITLGAGATLQGTANTLNNAGIINVGAGGIVTDAGDINNLAGGIINFAGAGSLTSGGPNGVVNSGTFNLQNGTAGNAVTITSNLVANTGSRTILDVDLANGMADSITVTGTANGETIIALDVINNGVGVDVTSTALGTPATFAGGQILATPLNLIDGNGGNISAQGGTGSDLIATSGLINYVLENNGAGDVFITSRVNGAAAAIPALPALIEAISATFYKPASTFVSCHSREPNGQPFSTWAQVHAGEVTTKTSGTATSGGTTNGVSAKLKTKYKGVQAGFDGALCNIDGDGTTVHVGFTGGILDATSRQTDTAGLSADLSTVFVGAYAAYAKGGFSADFTGRYDFHKFDLSHSDPTVIAAGTDVDGHTVSGSATATYKMDVNGMFALSPSAGVSLSHTSLDTFAIQSGTGTAEVKTKNSVIGFVGLSVRKPHAVNDNLTVIPFLSAAAYNQFVNDTKSEFIISGRTVDVETKRSSVWGQFSGGAEFSLLPDNQAAKYSNITGLLRFDAQYGKRLEGWAITAQLRAQF